MIVHYEGSRPRRAFVYDAGADLFADRDYTLPGLRTLLEKIGNGIPHDYENISEQAQEFVDTNIITKITLSTKIHIEPGFAGILSLEKSSVGAMGLCILAGVIDSGYVGPLELNIVNLGNDVVIKEHQKIAQLIIVPVIYAEFAKDKISELQTARGAKGFGSSGKF